MKRLVLTILAISLLFCPASAQMVVGSGGSRGINLSSDANLQGWWRFENSLADSSGKNNTLTLNATGTASYASGDAKDGLYWFSFDGSTSLGRTNNNLSAGFPGRESTPFTVGGWFRPTEIGAIQSLITDYTGISTSSYSLAISADGTAAFKVFLSDGTTAKAVTSTTVLSADTNYFIVGIWTGSSMQLYIGTDVLDVQAEGGSTACESMYAITSSDAIFSIGYWNNDNYAFTGYADDIAIFNDVLSLSEMQSWQQFGIDG
jgi:hypothetical protein